MTTTTPERRQIDVHVRNAEPPVPVAHLRAIGTSDGMAAQFRAHVIDLARWHADNGTKLDPTGRPVLRASEQRKVNRKIAEIVEIRGFIPGNAPSVTRATPATHTLTSNEALLRLADL